MKHAIRTATVFAFASLCLCSGADAKIVTFQLPQHARGMYLTGMNEKGHVTGYADDVRNGALRGFLWKKDGGFSTFLVPAPNGRGGDDVERIYATGITNDDVITGWLLGSGGFVRTADGTFTTFQLGQSTYVYGVNGKGWSVGSYAQNQQGLTQPFLRDPSGATKEFTVPGATGGAAATVLNRSRMIAGVAVVQGGEQAFFRPAHGAATLFGHVHYSVLPTGINAAGTVTGWFQNTKQYSARYTSFVRTSDGVLTTFVGPNHATVTSAVAINNSGTIAGTFLDSTGTHGFLRFADGTFTPFDIEGATWTGIYVLNDKGEIAGEYGTKDGVFGFAGKP